MLIQVPPARPSRRPRKAPAALTLVAAVYTAASYVRLTFDRAVSIAAIDVSAVVVDDGVTNHTVFHGLGTATLVTPVTVQVNLGPIGSSTASQVLLTATAATRIVGGDGGMWPGVANQVLPL